MRRLGVRKKLGYAVGVIAVLVGALELTARGLEWVRSLRAGPGVEAAVHDRFHPLRYELTPGAGLSANGPIAQINRDGLRGPDPDRPKRRVRVLCLGDSCTFGYAPDVTDQATYPAALGRRLDPERFEVVNGGMPGFGSLDILNYFVYKGLELHPDYVVILAGWNDNLHVQPLGPGRPTTDSPSAFLGRSALLRLEGEFVGRLIGPRAADLGRERARLERAPAPGDRLSDLAFSRTGRVIEELVQICRAHRCVPILVTYPNFTRPEWGGIDSLSDAELGPALPHLVLGELSPKGWRTFASTTNALIRTAAARYDVPLVDGDAIRDPSLFHDLCHLKAEGCEALARRVAPVLARAARQDDRDQAGWTKLR